MSEPADSVFNPQPKQNSGLGFFLVLMVVAAVAVGWYALRPMLNGGGNIKPAVDAEPLAELQLAPLTAGSTEVSLNNTSGLVPSVPRRIPRRGRLGEEVPRQRQRADPARQLRLERSRGHE
jgi:hypothetical protein